MGIKNQLKTVLFLGILTALLLWIGSFWGKTGIFIGLIFAFIMNFSAYWFSDKLVLAMYGAKEIKENDYPKLYRLVKEVVQLAKIPMPKLYIIHTSTPNAFATGRNPKHAAIAVTTGIIELLNEEELKAVIAHEISHIKHRDTLIQTIAATIAGVIAYIAMIARWQALFGSHDRDRGSALELLILAIITPIIATLIQLAISRSREFLADEGSAKLLHNGIYLANALEKLELGVKHSPFRATTTAQATAHLFIVNPFRATNLIKLFMTHPPTNERIKRLRELKL